MQEIFRKLLVAGIILIAVPAFCQIEPKAEPAPCPEGCEPEIWHVVEYDTVYWNEIFGWCHQTSADTTVYGDRNKLGSVQSVEIKE